MKILFGLAAKGAKFLKEKLTLRNIFGASATGVSGAVAVAPQQTGEFVGGRVVSLFNGLARGVGRGLLENPVVAVVGASALAIAATRLVNRLSR